MAERTFDLLQLVLEQLRQRIGDRRREVSCKLRDGLQKKKTLDGQLGTQKKGRRLEKVSCRIALEKWTCR